MKLIHLNKPSMEFLLFAIYRLYELGSVANRRFLVRRFNSNSIEITSFYDFLRLTLRRIETLRIESLEVKTIQDFKKLADAITFDIAYNTGFSFIQVKHIEEFSIPRRVNRRNRIEECEPPRRTYDGDLIYHYQLGLSTFHPALKFISFYHVLEHYFNIVFSEKMFQEIKFLITKPSFSPKRDKDIEKLIKEIKNNLKLETDSNTAKNEIESLKLVLKKFIDLENLVTSIKELDPELITYYSSKKVGFSQGSSINFKDEKSAFGNLANRIYKTRNAVIHSKAYEEERYIPFEHENQLLKEIPLIQLIAEEVILRTSKIL